jgi:FixJ family two-component response regulator
MDKESRSLRVLVVVDDLTFATFVCQALEKLGAVAEVSFSGQDAIRRTAAEDWCGVLLDLKLPDLDGLTILRETRQRGDTAPIFVITGAGDVSVAVEAMKLGAMDFLSKPLSYSTLAGVVDQLRGVSRSRPTDRPTIEPISARPISTDVQVGAARHSVRRFSARRSDGRGSVPRGGSLSRRQDIPRMVPG